MALDGATDFVGIVVFLAIKIFQASFFQAIFSSLVRIESWNPHFGYYDELVENVGFLSIFPISIRSCLK